MGEDDEVADRRRKEAVLAGATHWATVDLIDLGTDGVGIRSALEQFGVRVNRVPVGQARHLVAALSEGHAAFFALSYLFYELTEGRSVVVAAERLRGHDSELAMWRYFR
jgi:hypothetical protein